MDHGNFLPNFGGRLDYTIEKSGDRQHQSNLKFYTKFLKVIFFNYKAKYSYVF
jgi:hypothetical protein